MKNLLNLEHSLGYYFNDKNLLKIALLHKSFGNENRKYKKVNNERLEFLGDTVLGLVIAEYLFMNNKDASEGTLAKMKAMIVSEPILAKISRKLKIGEYLLLSKGEEMTGGRDRDSILGDVFEAILGAIYIDSNFKEAKEYALNHMKEYIDHIEEDEDILDYKTILQEYVQKEFKEVPEYKVIEESGPDHMKKFKIRVKIREFSGIGTAGNKKKAEQLSAKDLCVKLGVKYNEIL